MSSVLTYALRNEQFEDEPFAVELYRSLRDDDDFAGCTRDQQLKIIAFGRDIERQTIQAVCPTARASIIVVDGEPAGELIVERTPSCIRLIEIAIAPDLQGRGIGSDIVRALCEEAAKRGVPLVLRVLLTNQRARKFYARHGFVVTDSDEMYVDLMWRGTKC